MAHDSNLCCFGVLITDMTFFLFFLLSYGIFGQFVCYYETHFQEFEMGFDKGFQLVNPISYGDFSYISKSKILEENPPPIFYPTPT